MYGVLTELQYLGLSLALSASWLAVRLWFRGTWPLVLALQHTNYRWYSELQHTGTTVYPHHLRWLLPTLARCSPSAWRTVVLTSLVVFGPCLYSFFRAWELTPERALFATTLVLGIWGVFGDLAYQMYNSPDAPSNLLAVAGATAWLNGDWLLALTLVVCAACFRETAPVTAALSAAAPLLLLGLLAPLARKLFWVAEGDCADEGEILVGGPMRDLYVTTSYVEAAWMVREHRLCTQRYDITSPFWVFLPWGLALILALFNPSWWLLLAVSAGYVLVVMATDTDRLVVTPGFAVVALHAATVPPDVALVFLGALQLTMSSLVVTYVHRDRKKQDDL